jgi:hypothetical protein
MLRRYREASEVDAECSMGGEFPWKVNDAVDCGDRLLGGWCSKDRTAEDWWCGKEGTLTIINASRAHMSAPCHVLA